ncbi:MAG: IS1 family transposase, partial [Holosporaceae bacterium]|nr:IS1 family transposase [Holosporaceae bacterium]
SKKSRLRHYLARLARKTKCYSKSLQMLVASLNIFIFHDLLKTIIN